MTNSNPTDVSVQNIIVISDLTKYYGSEVGIENLSLEINKGEIYGFLGQNGAGKTTTIRCILNILIPDTGKVTVNGTEINRDNSEIKENMGYLPGEWYIPGGYKVGKFLEYIATLRKNPSHRMQEMVERFKLPINKKIKQLSKGNKQKMGIILAFMHDPEILILDEPTSGLDPLLQQEVYDLLLEEKKRGKTIFFSSHNLDEVQKICDRVAIIREGELVSIETVKDLADKIPRKLIASFYEIDDVAVEKLGDKVTNFNAELKEVEINITNGDSLSDVLSYITSLGLKDLSYPPASLESYFLSKYDENPQEA
ncbi:MAG: ABC transporter ATP-binding protein [Candidatus Kariarchaeaceae archaeon]|jgi:ABC-2 type transport system ATP-binding protein